MSLETWEETLKNHSCLLPSRHVRSGSCPRSPKWFPASVTICTCETHLESRLNSSILWFRLEPRSNSKIGGNDRIHSSILFPHLLWLDNPYTFSSLLSSGFGLIQGGCLHRAIWARCLSLSCHSTTLCMTQPGTFLMHCAVTFLVWHPIMSVSFFSISQGAQNYLLNERNYCPCVWAGTYCSRSHLSMLPLLMIFPTFSPAL